MNTVYIDFHIHSKYSRATSKNISITTLENGARLKGLNLLGSGDFTHPLWLKELKRDLKEINNTGVFETKTGFKFILSTEISNIYSQDGKIRKIHNLILAPNFNVVEQINEFFGKHGNLSADGRPIFGKMNCAELAENLINISKEITIIPSHVFTPWFSLFGSMSGFDSVEQCFQEKSKYIYALESGLSADPAMVWRISSFDKYTIVSNSDAHSFWPWRLGREFNVLNLKEISFKAISETLKNKKNFLYTCEVPPSLGKYHFDGHRSCRVSLEPKESIKYKNTCPVCKKQLTIGVLHRVEELADREEGYVPKKAIPFKSLLPLYEVISYVTGVSHLYSKKVVELQDRLIERFGTELAVLLEAPEEEIKKIVDERIAAAILLNREGKIKIQPGYDGVYGIPIFDGPLRTGSPQKRLDTFR